MSLNDPMPKPFDLSENSNPTEIELAWRYYLVLADLQKNYLDLTIKANTLYYTACFGVIGVFAVKPQLLQGIAGRTLLLPALLGLTLCVVALVFARGLIPLQDQVFRLGHSLRFRTHLDFSRVTLFLYASALCFGISGVGFLSVFWSN